MTYNEKADEFLEMSNAIEQVVREFIEMMEADRKAAEQLVGDSAASLSDRYKVDIRWDALNDTIESHEFEALKALLEDESANSSIKEKTYNVRGEHNGYITTKDGRSYYEVLEDKPAAEGWIKWEGGRQPVGDDVIVEAKFRGNLDDVDKAAYLHWRHSDDADADDILAYRLVKEPSQEKKSGKQTFLEFIGCENFHKLKDNSAYLARHISEYLEQED